MLLKSDFICLNSLGWQKDDSSIGMTVALFLGHNHTPRFHLSLNLQWKSLSFLACSCWPLHKAIWFCFWSFFSKWTQIIHPSASNLWFICHNVLYDVPRMLQTSYICTPHNRLNAYFPHFHRSHFMMEDLNIQTPQPMFGDMKHEYHSTFVPYSWCHHKRLL